MDKKSRSDKSTDELKVEIVRSRERVERAVVGTLLVLLPARKKKIYIDARTGDKRKKQMLEAGFFLGALKIAATLLKPVITTFLTKKISGYVGTSRSAKN